MSYLIKPDYLSLSREDNVNVLTGDDDSKLIDVEVGCIQEISSYLNARYDLTKTFPDVKSYTLLATFTKDDIIYATATAWVAGVYAVGALVSNGGNIYKCIQVTVNEATTNAAFWTLWGANNKFYSAVADVVAGVALTVGASYLIGDTRVAMLKRIVIDLVLYELHARINPRNIPDFRIERRDQCIAWLKLASNAKNNVNAEFLTLITYADGEDGTKRANNMTWGSRTKLTTKY